MRLIGRVYRRLDDGVPCSPCPNTSHDRLKCRKRHGWKKSIPPTRASTREKRSRSPPRSGPSVSWRACSRRAPASSAEVPDADGSSGLHQAFCDGEPYALSTTGDDGRAAAKIELIHIKL